MPSLLGRLYGRLGPGYFWLYMAFEVVSVLLVCLATVGMFSLYTEMDASEFVKVTLFAELCAAAACGYTIFKTAALGRPVTDWLRNGRGTEGAREAWFAAVALPREFVVRNGWQPVLIVGLPTSLFLAIEFDLPAYGALIIFAGAVVAVAYVEVLHFFVAEQFLRPVIDDLVKRLPPDFAGAAAGVPLRWKLLGALPIVNVITGVVVSGLSTNGTASLEDLGVDVVVALLVAFTISLELTVLVTRSVLRPVDDLLVATKAAAQGDLDARVPVTSGDELGELAVSFNAMMRGLSEREALRGAFGSYVDPIVADRVLEEGQLLEGEDREVTVMFGAPDRHADHADRAVASARAIVAAVDRHFGGEVSVGIGLNSGPVVVGSVGGGGRLEFSVIGDPVNISARAERATRDTGDVVLITEATRALLTRGRENLVPRGALEFKGINEPVSLYALPSSISTPVDERPTPSTPPLVADV